MDQLKKKILIVDDEPVMLLSYKKLFAREEKYNVTLMQDPGQALKLVTMKNFDLIISDLKMNEISGLDILKTALASFPDCIVVIVSGYGTIENIEECMKHGAFDFINKPFSSQTLFDTVNRALKENYPD